MLILEATMEKVCYLNDKRMRELAELKDVKAIADAVHVRTRWVLCSKGDPTKPDMRARLVACEVNKTGKEGALFASTPLGESNNKLFLLFASRRHVVLKNKQVPLRLSFIDTKKAYFKGIPARDIFMSLPPDLGLPKH